MVQGVELTYDIDANALDMAQAIFGDGVTVVGASVTGDRRASAVYSDGDAISPGVVPGDSGIILSTGDTRGFTSVGPESNTRTNLTTSSNGPDNYPLFDDLAGRATFDASYLNVDFIPDPGIEFITMEFVFSSDEYPEYAGSIYNDMVGIWIDGQVVPLAAGNGLASVGNINAAGGPNLFVSNVDDTFNTEMDGFTVSMSVVIPVNPGEINSLRIGVADVGDNLYDSNLLIASDSIQGALVAETDNVLLRPGDNEIVDIQANDINNTGGMVTITEIGGQPVFPGQSVVLTTGQVVTLNPDGTITLVSTQESEDVAFTYEVTSTTGQSAVGFIIVDTVPCFARGTRIRTDRGNVPVECLAVGSLVETRDAGLQQIRWIGHRRLPAEGHMAPVLIPAGHLGEHDDLLISPQHRVLLRNSHAELLFGTHEVLIAAQELVDGRAVRQVTGGWVEYFHILFDHHHIVWSEGLETESFLPGPQTMDSFDASTLNELTTLFPQFSRVQTARPSLRSFEARALVG